MSFHINPLHATDSYKLGHIFQYPEGTQYVYSNTTARDDSHFQAPAGFHDGKIVMFGLQGALLYIVNLWEKEFFDKSKDFVIKNYINRIIPFSGDKEISTLHIEDLHDLQYLPIRVKAIPEGNRVNMKVPLFTITNTDPRFFWLVNYLETWLQNETWKPMTVATIAYTFRKILEKYADETGAPKDFVPWQGHDFSCRGMSGMHDASRSGAGHLLSFTGSDTICAVDWLEDAYFGWSTFTAGSVPASEHSVMTMGGPEGEMELIKRIITEIYPSGIVSIVSDSYDFWRVITKGAASLKTEIMSRKPDALGNAKTVFRPDSGNPVDILCGTARWITYEVETGTRISQERFWDIVRTPSGKYFKPVFQEESQVHVYKEIESTPELKGAVECLWDTFGGTLTSKGYKLLDSHVGLIYGDSITMERADTILSLLKRKGFASTNVVFGIGSYTYNHITRDVFGLAMKATYGVVDGIGREIYKDPKTANGMKKSAKGLLMVEKVGHNFVLQDQVTPQEEKSGELITIFEDNKWPMMYTLEGIRNRLWPKE